MTERPANRLATETSPYLRQHAHNPVDWYPWGDEAFAKARAEDKPVFLSIGYAACHWCHVMERESFEDEETAAYLNARFVSIKVDREERPDVDGIYMDAVQAMTGSGGWPMTVFLTPSGEPFWAGTYFPDEPRHGMPSFRQVLAGIAAAWADRRGEIGEQAARVTQAIGAAAALDGSHEPLTIDVSRHAFATLRRSFDAVHGGFGGAPKFPQPMTLEFVLRMAQRGEADAAEIVERTLRAMADGGIHDHVSGGFARYATDDRWLVPHFEKMLYDNAQLAQLYTHAWLATREPRWEAVAHSTLDYLLREMRHPEGGFFSSQDADSEGEEGRFAVWTWGELVAVVGEEEARRLGASHAGNWEGRNVLWLPDGRPPDDDVRRRLAETRAARVSPGIDDKVLTAWNALAIRAFAVAGRAFEEPRYVEAAAACGAFVWASLRDADGRLLRSWRDGAASTPAFADDHALLVLAFLTLFETTADAVWFARAREVADALVGRFFDAERGGFFQTAADGERLVVRPKELSDNAVPSANSAAAEALLRLALFTEDPDVERAGVSALQLVRDLLLRAPAGFGHALVALDLLLGPTREVAVIGDPADPRTGALVAPVVRDRFSPNAVVAIVAPGEEPPGLDLVRDRPQIDGVPTAYVCERFTCRLPTSDPAVVAAQLLEQGPAPSSR